MMEEDWSADQTLAKVTETGAFGLGCRFVSFHQDDNQTKQSQYASIVVFGTATVADAESHRRQWLVIKLKLRQPELRALLKNDLQFHNEVLFYEKFSPLLLACVSAEGASLQDRVPLLPRYFYGRNDCGDLWSQDLIVMENMSVYGYRPAKTDHQLILDVDHVIIALKTLAKFHGLSYRAKRKNPVKFAELVSEIKDTQWDENGDWLPVGFGLHELFTNAVNRLIERDGTNERIQRFQADALGDAVETLRDAMRPAEPLAVLCHGDFNRNNLLFLYNDGGKPVDVLPIDMATVRYGSPTLDLSFFLYMNTDRALRDGHWDELLDTYCATLAASVSDVADDVPALDRAQLDAEMRAHAYYGLAHTSFFLRVMMESDKELNQNDLIDLDNDEIMRLVMSCGGDKSTDMFADAVQHFLNVVYTESSSP